MITILKELNMIFLRNQFFPDSKEDYEQIIMFYIKFDFLFGIPDKANDVEINVKDNQVLKELCYSDYLKITDRRTNKYSSSTQRTQFEEIQPLTYGPIEGDDLPT